MPRPTAHTFTQQQLRVFTAVAEHRSLAAAARALGMAQPTICGHLDTLERLIGMPLVTRTRGSRQTVLTDAGAMFLPTATEILEQWARGIDLVRSHHGLERRSITIGSMPHFGTYILPRLVELFERERPGVNVRIEIGRIADMVRGIRAGLMDLAISFGPVDDDEVLQERYDDTDLVMVGPSSHRLAAVSKAPFAELARERLVTTEPTPLSPGGFLMQMAAAQGVTLNVVMISGDIQPRIQAMIAGRGIGPVYVDSVEPELESGQLSILPVEGFPLRVQRMILSPRTEIPTAAKEFRDHLLRNAPAIGTRTFLSSTH